MSNQVISVLGCGWLGKPLGSALVSAGYEVNGSTTTQAKAVDLKAAGIFPFVFRVDELAVDGFDTRFFNSDVLIISLPHGARSGNADHYVEHVKSVIRVAKTASTKHIILISTTSVYPNLCRVVTEEDADKQNPIVKAEQIVFDSGIAATVVRFGGLYGPGRDPGKFLANKKNVDGGNIPVNMIHLEDCINIFKSIIQLSAWGQVLNACADEHPTRKEFYTKAALASGLEPPTFSEKPGDYKIVSNERLKSALGYRFLHQP